MTWTIGRPDVVRVWMIRASANERSAMREFARSLVADPAAVGMCRMVHPATAEELHFAMPDGLACVVAWLTDEENELVTLVGIEPCLDGLIFQAAGRLVSDDA